MIAPATRRTADRAYSRDALVTDGELLGILRSFGASRGARGFSTDDAMAVVRWAEAARVEESMLRMVLDGTVGVDVHEGGQILFVVKEDTHAAR